jgi:hypothetical protein
VTLTPAEEARAILETRVLLGLPIDEAFEALEQSLPQPEDLELVWYGRGFCWLRKERVAA